MLNRHLDPDARRHLAQIRKQLYPSGLSAERRLVIAGTWALRNADGHVVRCTPTPNEHGFAYSLGKVAYATRADAEACAEQMVMNSNESDPKMNQAYECDNGERHWHLTSRDQLFHTPEPREESV